MTHVVVKPALSSHQCLDQLGQYVSSPGHRGLAVTQNVLILVAFRLVSFFENSDNLTLLNSIVVTESYFPDSSTF